MTYTVAAALGVLGALGLDLLVLRTRLVAGRDPWAELMPPPQRLSPGLIEEGRAIPVARVQAMHEGKRRARARRDQQG